jgi:hypothetical protein
MTTVASLGGGHCCICTTVCGHIGGPYYCARHSPLNQPVPVPSYTYPTNPDLDRAREREDFRRRLAERMEADARLLERIEAGPDWHREYEQEAAKFRAETITTSFLATLLRQSGHPCEHCATQVGTTVIVGPDLSRQWRCNDCAQTTTKGSSTPPRGD